MAISFRRAKSGDRLRQTVNRMPLSRKKRIPVFLILMLPLFQLSCRSGPWPDPTPEFLERDYYFQENAIQIQGKSVLPSEKVPPDTGVNRIDIPRYLSLSERRDLCQKEAELNARIKWLALTSIDRQDPAEWKRRLNLGAKGPWSSCLEKAESQRVFYDSQDTCRVVMIIPCRPQDY